MKTSELDVKRTTRIPWPQRVKLPEDIGKYIVHNAEEVTRIGWTKFLCRQQGALIFFCSVEGRSPEAALVAEIQAPRRASCAEDRRMVGRRTSGGLEAGTSQNHYRTRPFLHEEFISMVEKEKWTVVPYSVSNRLLGLRLSPPGVKVERDGIPLWLGDYSYFKTSAKTLPVPCMSSIYHGSALDRLLRKMVFADPA